MRLIAARCLILALISYAVPIAGASAQGAGQPNLHNSAVVRVKGYGPTESDARQDAVRAALQQTMQQLIVADRVIKDDQVVRDKIMSTMNGYIEKFTQIGSGRVNGSVFVEADVTVSPSKISNFIAAGYSTSTQVAGGSLFAESQREMYQRRSKGEIFDKLLDGFPGSVMKARVVSIAPDEKKAGDFMVKVEVSYSDEWVRAFTSGLQALSVNMVPVTISRNACAGCFNAETSAAIDTLHRLPEFQQQTTQGRRSPMPSVCVFRWPTGVCAVLPAGEYAKSLKYFQMQEPNLLLALQVVDATGQSAIQDNRSCLVKYIGNAWVLSKLVDPTYDPENFFFLLDTAPRIFEFGIGAKDLQTDRAKEIIAVPFFVTGGHGLLKDGPDMLATYAFGPETDQLKGGVTNLRNEQVDDICSEVKSIPVHQASTK
jgi:hypothetical protein